MTIEQTRFHFATTVYNLGTDESWVFTDTGPEDAVIRAYLYSVRHNRNTWDWPALCKELRSKIIRGAKTVALGNFCALS